jgi:hypothetical protein
LPHRHRLQSRRGAAPLQSASQSLGYSPSGKKIVGRFDFKPRQILIDELLPCDFPRFRVDPVPRDRPSRSPPKVRLQALISREQPHCVDTKTELRFIRSARWSDLNWVEWQANQFASAILLPRPICISPSPGCSSRKLSLAPAQYTYTSNPATIDYREILQHVSKTLNVSRTVLRIRLLHLGILNGREARKQRSCSRDVALFAGHNHGVSVERTVPPVI